MDPGFDEDDYFLMEEFIFPEHGGVTGTTTVTCPHCSVVIELEIDVGNVDDRYECDRCGKPFSVNWVTGTVTGHGRWSRR